ncbi:CmcJ/NvfI family oxidoreductase [Microbulbifer sp. TRSA002]|uniref:CmcJ/NvfI family oxidoreductase n=1 Tax=Microbulbifer sp. TRSA002 TaxID=3243382 RepID=UPI004039C9CD
MQSAARSSFQDQLVTAIIHYADPSSDLVYDKRSEGPGPANLVENVISQQVHIYDGRALKTAGERFRTDTQGFELVRPMLGINLRQLDDALHALDQPSGSSPSPQERDQLIRTQWYPAIESWIAAHLGAAKVLTFDHTLRAQPSTDATPELSRSRRSPVKLVHNDYTPWSAERQLKETLEARGYKPSDYPRYQFINLWLPLLRPVQESPLAMVDLRTVAASDFHNMRLIYPERKGQISVLSFNPVHRWIWFSDMQPGEGILLRVFDSQHRGDVTGVPHCAFDLPGSAGAPRRTSLEIRTIVLFDQ